MTMRANLRIALPPGWVGLHKDALVTALGESFPDLDEVGGGLMDRLRSAETHLIAFSPSPVTGKPQAILTASVIGHPAGAIGVGDQLSEDWAINRWSGRSTLGGATEIERAARSFALSEADQRGLIALYEVEFEPEMPGAVVMILMKLHEDLTDEAVGLFDDIASTVSVTPLSQS